MEKLFLCLEKHQNDDAVIGYSVFMATNLYRCKQLFTAEEFWDTLWQHQSPRCSSLAGQSGLGPPISIRGPILARPGRGDVRACVFDEVPL